MNTRSITHPELVRALVKPGKDIVASMTARSADLWHAATGVAGEGAEILQAVAFNTNGLARFREDIIEELGDLFFYVEQIEQNIGPLISWPQLEASVRAANSDPWREGDAWRYASGVAVYSGLVLDSIKKLTVYNKPLDTSTLASHLAMMLQYALGLGMMVGVTRDTALDANIKKLSKRYEGLTYSDEAAQKRADKPAGE